MGNTDSGISSIGEKNPSPKSAKNQRTYLGFVIAVLICLLYCYAQQ